MKWKKGRVITSLEEFAEQKLIYDSRMNKVYDRGWFQSWQFRYVKTSIDNKAIYTVVKEGEKND